MNKEYNNGFHALEAAKRNCWAADDALYAASTEASRKTARSAQEAAEAAYWAQHRHVMGVLQSMTTEEYMKS